MRTVDFRLLTMQIFLLKFFSKMVGIPNKWLRKAKLLFRWRRLCTPSAIKRKQKKINKYRRFAHFFKLFELPKEKSTIASTLKYGHNITTRTINKFFRQRKSCRHRLTAYPTRASRARVYSPANQTNYFFWVNTNGLGTTVLLSVMTTSKAEFPTMQLQRL